MNTDIDIHAAHDFVATHARILDRRRLELRTGDAGPAAVLAALDAYRNADGGYGWGLEPDLRSPESQPATAGHAFETFADVAPVTAPQAVALCDWLEGVTLPDGGLPFALPTEASAGNGPWWGSADPTVSSLQITTFVTAAALQVGAHDRAVASHRWLARAVDYCVGAIERIEERPFAYVLEFALRFLDGLHGRRAAEAERALAHLREFVPPDGTLAVQGGAEGEALRPLDLAPFPGTLSRSLLGDAVIAADLERLAGLQQDDGGWVVDYLKISPAGALEWRGYATVRALEVLRRNGAIS
jgi:hypothetical protein